MSALPAGEAAAALRRQRATAIGFSAVLMWALLALLTVLTGAVPPFQLLALTFGIAFAGSLLYLLLREPARLRHLAQPAPVWLLGVGGLFGYHFFYFTALDNAPPAEAGLIAYLSPLLIVVASGLLPGERLRWFHVAGALMGLAGTAWLVLGGSRAAGDGNLLGYGAAFACALTWTAYSVLNRRFAAVPTDVVVGFCGGTAILALLCHLAWEATVWPAGPEWLAVLGLGLGPVGAAFFTWDHGTKHGHIQALGASFYAAPLLSTAILVLTGFAEPGWRLAGACALIVGGAALASIDLFRRRR